MKKLLLVLTVVAMASFLLVGCIPTVPVAVTGVTLDQATMALTAGGATGTLVETVVPADATDKTVTWSSSAPAVATVANGVVTPLTAGTTTITVTTVDGSLTATCEVTVSAAPVPPVAPVITAIPDQEVAWDGAPWTYQVAWTVGTGTITGFSLAGEPATMTISATGLITWTNIAPAPAVYAVTVRVDASDGEYDTETFVITITEPVVIPLVIDIDVPDAYVHPTKGPIVAADCYDVVVTFSDNSVTEGQDVWARWNDVVGEAEGPWVLLDANADYTEFTTEEICFDTEPITECIPICIEVKVGTICCDPIIYSEMITVDTIAPCASFTVTFEDCDPCVEGAEMSWVTTCEDICADPFDCCGDNCSGVGDWSFVLDDDECEGPCDTETGNDCPINGAFECGCLLYADSGEVVVYVIDVSIVDNVDNEFTDTWTLTFDTDSLVSLVSSGTDIEVTVGEEWTVDYGCEWDDCDECMPE